jgi:signal transduction histidine kinase
MKHRAVSGFSLTVILLVIIGWFSYTSILKFRSTADLVSRSHYLANIRESLLTDIVSAESEARGYVIMGREEYLNLYAEAVSDVKKGIQRLREVQAQSVSPDLVERIINLIEMRLERLRITIEARQLEGLDAVVGVAGIGKRLMDEVRAVVAENEAVEDKNLGEAAVRLREVSERTTWIIGMGSVLAVVFHLASTLALSRATSNRERLERSLLDVSEREQRRIGQDLHDGLCQQLTGISLMISSLHRKMLRGSEHELTQISALINSSIEETRLVTRGLHPVPDEPGGLVVGLRELVDGVHSNSMVNCELSILGAVQITDAAISSNLYRIAQEAVRNALKHSGAKNITILLQGLDPGLDLKIKDDGGGLPKEPSRRGLGLEIMKYRAASIGGNLNIACSHGAGTLVHFRLAQTRPLTAN